MFSGVVEAENGLFMDVSSLVVHCGCELGTEELGHWEMLGVMIRQCMAGCTCQELNEAGLSGYYILHDHGVFPADPNGVPFSSTAIAVTGDPVADLVEDMAADGTIV